MNNSAKTFVTKNITNIILMVVFAMFILVPIVFMFANIKAADFNDVIHSQTFGKAIGNSVLAAGISTVLSVSLAYALAYCIERVNIRCKSVFKVIFTLPMLIPSISHGMGIILLFGNNGVITKLLGISTSSIYGLTGIVLGSVLYSFPVAFLMLSDIMKYEDALPYEAASVLGIPKSRQFTSITLPYLKKPLISVVFMVFSLVVTDYGVPIIVGGKFATVPTVLYQEVLGQVQFGKGAIYGSLLLVPAIIAFVLDVVNKEHGKSNFTTKPIALQQGRVAQAVTYAACALVSAFVLLPIGTFLVISFVKSYPNNMSFTFANVSKAFKMNAGTFLGNSLAISLLVATVGVVIAFATAYLTARAQQKSAKFLHMAALLSATVPGLVVGLSYIITFKNSLLAGTITIMVIVNTVHFISSPYLMIYNSLGKMNRNIEGVGASLGVGKMRLIKDVFIPQCKTTIIEMFVYFFVNSMMTISAVSFLATAGNKPLSLLLNQFEDRQIECAAFVSLLILIVNLAMKGVAEALKKLNFRKLIKRKNNVESERI